jgi:hypothetical protein
MKKIFTSLSLFVAFFQMQAQTNPAPFDLSTGNYTFTEWADTSAAGTYPPNMMFHTDTVIEAPVFNALNDWTCPYNLSSRARINGENSGGISFTNTGNAQSDLCSTGGTTTIKKFLGAAVVALNTLNRENIQVSWTGSMLSNFTYGSGTNTQTRFYQIQLQYAVGANSAFIDVPGSVFNCNSDSITYKPANTTEIIPTVTLPTACNNEPLVFVRWLYRKSNNGSNQRPKLAFDDVNITSSIFTGLKNISESNKNFNIYPNPSVDHVLNISKPVTANIYNTIGSLVSSINNSNKIDLSNCPSGVYFVRTNKGEVEKIILK